MKDIKYLLLVCMIAALLAGCVPPSGENTGGEIGSNPVMEEDSPMYNYRHATFIVTYPDLDVTDPVLSQWYWENDIKDLAVSYSGSTDLTLYDDFIYRYYSVIQHAKEYV